ncbi:MAG: permease-like cell division protein FtsX [Proteobacteria bacterium]|nr:permease-like cell division protein FtsX [Pseudomonadota bacterium]
MSAPTRHRWLYLATHILRRAPSGIRRKPWIHLLSILTLSAAFLSFAATLTAAININEVVARWIGSAEMTVYLHKGTTPAQLDELRDAVLALDGIAKVDTVTPAQARTDFSRDLGALNEINAFISDEAFPASLDIYLTPTASSDGQARQALAKRLGEVKIIEEVELYDDWFNRLHALSTMGRTAALGLGVLALVVSILVVAATIRQGVSARRREIEVMRFVGATEHYVRVPFLIEGALESLLSMLIALVSLHFLLNHVQDLAGDILPMLGSATLMRLPGGVLLALIAGGLLSGLLGARISLRKLEEV